MPRKKHFEVELITPDGLEAKRKRIIRCLTTECGLRYSIKDYRVLFEAKKLMYFDVMDMMGVKSRSVICHDCLFKLILRLTGSAVAQVLIIDPDKKMGYKCKFYPEGDKEWLGLDE